MKQAMAPDLPWPGNQYAGERRWRPCDWLLYPAYLAEPPAEESDPDKAFSLAVVREAATAFILALGLAVVVLSTVLHSSPH